MARSKQWNVLIESQTGGKEYRRGKTREGTDGRGDGNEEQSRIRRSLIIEEAHQIMRGVDSAAPIVCVHAARQSSHR